MSERPSGGAGPLCIIPARGGSKRFPRKNLALIGGRPLVSQAISVARASGVFNAICVSSEDDEILSVAKDHGADLVLRRTGELARDDVQVKDVCRSILEERTNAGYEHPTFAVLLPTSPLRTAADVRQAYNILLETDADCCMSLVACEHPPQRAVWMSDGYVKPYFGGEYLKPAQSLETLYRHDGTIIFARTAPFLREETFYGAKVVPYLVPRERAVDVDNPLDLAWAEFLLQSGVIRSEATPSR